MGALGPVEGSGSLSAASGSTSDSRNATVSGGMSLSGVLLDGTYSSLVGTAMNSLEAAKQASGNARGTFLFSDSDTYPTSYGPETTTVKLFAGWKGQAATGATAGGELDVEFGLVNDEISYEYDEFTGKRDGEVDGASTSAGKDFIDLDVVSFAERDFSGTSGDYYYDNSDYRFQNLKYTDESAGTSLGELEGIIELEDISNASNGKLKGTSRSVLVFEGEYGGDTLSVLTATQDIVHEAYGFDSQYEEIRQVTEIEGELQVGRVDDGPVDVTIDAEYTTTLTVEYDRSQDYFESWGWEGCYGCQNLYDWTRDASLSGARVITSSINGTASIDPDSASGDTGGFSLSSDDQYSGDSETLIIDLGNAPFEIDTKTEREAELEQLLGIFVEPEDPGSGYGGYGGYGSLKPTPERLKELISLVYAKYPLP